MRKSIRLTRAGLRKIIKESVGAILSESGDTKRGAVHAGPSFRQGAHKG